MKKIYQAPKMKVVEVKQRAQLLAGSPDSLGVYGNTTDQQI